MCVYVCFWLSSCSYHVNHSHRTILKEQLVSLLGILKNTVVCCCFFIPCSFPVKIILSSRYYSEELPCINTWMVKSLLGMGTNWLMNWSLSQILTYSGFTNQSSLKNQDELLQIWVQFVVAYSWRVKTGVYLLQLHS